MEKKCILFVRISTELQHFDEQEQELFQMALNDGYLRNNIIPIAEIESGRKLKEEERKGLNKMKQYIEEDSNIDCVYLWEISRLARKQKVLMSIRDYLIERKINVKIKTPMCTLLNPDGSINDGADILFSIYSQMSEAEMRTKIARFKRTKKANAHKMKYSGGKVLFGYKLDENKYYQINEEQAEIIRLMYDLYTSKNIGAVQLRKELEERGYSIKGYLIHKILSNTAYIGYHNYPNGNNRKYPPIITEEIFNKAQRKKEENKTNCDKSKNNIWLCAKLIKCTECNTSMMANGGARVYRCKSHAYHHFYKKNCSNNLTINIQVMDGIAWHYASSYYVSDTLTDKEKQIKDYETQIKILKQKINAGEKLNKKFDERKARIIYNFEQGDIDKEERDKKMANLYTERKEFEIRIATHYNDIQRLENEIKYLQKDKKDLTAIQKIKERLHLSSQRVSRQDMYNIVHRYIKEIQITDTKLYFYSNEFGEEYIYKERITDDDTEKKAREIKILGINGKIDIYYFMYTQKTMWKQYAKYNETTDRISPIVVIKQ